KCERQATRDINSLEFSVCEKSDRPAIGRPEGMVGVGRPGKGSCLERLERVNMQKRLTILLRHERQLPPVRRNDRSPIGMKRCQRRPRGSRDSKADRLRERKGLPEVNDSENKCRNDTGGADGPREPMTCPERRRRPRKRPAL